MVNQHADRVLRVAGSESGAAAVRLAPGVDVSWRRCLSEFKLDPERDYEPTVLDPGHLRELQEEHEDLVQIARAEMDSLYEQVAGSGYALLLAVPEAPPRRPDAAVSLSAGIRRSAA